MPPAMYTGPNTEDTPVIVEATAFKQGIVIAQVNELRNAVPRVTCQGTGSISFVQSPAALHRAALYP